MPITYRPATRSDLDGILEVFLACWRDSYAEVLPRRLVETMTDAYAGELWMNALDGSVSGEVIVAEEASTATILGVTRFAVGAQGDGVVHSLYVSPMAQGRGVGSRLLMEASRALSAAGASTAHLWVFADNAPSVAFYGRQGWLPDAATRVQEEFGELESRLVRTLAKYPPKGLQP